MVQRLNSGELLQQIAGQKPIEEQTTREISTPIVYYNPCWVINDRHNFCRQFIVPRMFVTVQSWSVLSVVKRGFFANFCFKASSNLLTDVV